MNALLDAPTKLDLVAAQLEEGGYAVIPDVVAQGEVCVRVPRGGAMVMKPLLLHASSKVSINNRRRVLHFVFGPASLPSPLRWPMDAAVVQEHGLISS